MFGWISRVFGTVAAPAPPEPIPMVVEDEDADLQLTAEELRQAELATELWPFVELSQGLRARYETADGSSGDLSEVIYEKWKERAKAARSGRGIGDAGTREFEKIIDSRPPDFVSSDDHEKAKAAIQKALAEL